MQRCFAAGGVCWLRTGAVGAVTGGVGAIYRRGGRARLFIGGEAYRMALGEGENWAKSSAWDSALKNSVFSLPKLRKHGSAAHEIASRVP